MCPNCGNRFGRVDSPATCPKCNFTFSVENYPELLGGDFSAPDISISGRYGGKFAVRPYGIGTTKPLKMTEGSTRVGNT